MDYDRYNQVLEWVIGKADLGYISYIYAKYLWDKEVALMSLSFFLLLLTFFLTYFLSFKKLDTKGRFDLDVISLPLIWCLFAAFLAVGAFKVNFAEIKLLDVYKSDFYRSLTEKQKSYFNDRVDEYHLNIFANNSHLNLNSDNWANIRVGDYLRITKDIIIFEETEMSLKNKDEYEAFKRDNYERISLLYKLKQKEDSKNK